MGSWIGVDLDRTLAIYVKWEGSGIIGEPILPMVSRVKRWISEGKDVRIFTARVAEDPNLVERRAIEAWCLKYIGKILPVTCKKDKNMDELWDDIAVQVIPNTGCRVDGKMDEEDFW